MMNEDKGNPSWSSFLIDLDLAIKAKRENASGALNKTGTRPFMAIGRHYGEKPTFMHDLESLFLASFLDLHTLHWPEWRGSSDS
jgi:Fungal protein kinase